MPGILYIRNHPVAYPLAGNLRAPDPRAALRSAALLPGAPAKGAPAATPLQTPIVRPSLRESPRDVRRWAPPRRRARRDSAADFETARSTINKESDFYSLFPVRRSTLYDDTTTGAVSPCRFSTPDTRRPRPAGDIAAKRPSWWQDGSDLRAARQGAAPGRRLAVDGTQCEPIPHGLTRRTIQFNPARGRTGVDTDLIYQIPYLETTRPVPANRRQRHASEEPRDMRRVTQSESMLPVRRPAGSRVLPRRLVPGTRRRARVTAGPAGRTLPGLDRN